MRGGGFWLRCAGGAPTSGVPEAISEPNLATVGWREWISLPELGIEAIKAKVDTGARSSALHTGFIEPYEKNGVTMVRFGLRPHLGWPDHNVECHAEIADRRQVKDSSGNPEIRYFIRTPVQVGEGIWTIDLSLTSRTGLKFRMLLGREAVRRRVLVDPGKSYLTRKPPKRRLS